MGDFVKGPLGDRFPKRISQGVMLHRKIDSYADRHPMFRKSRQQLAPEFGLYRGIMLDLFYDYFLVNHWQRFSDEPFNKYLDRSRRIIEKQRGELPPDLQRFLPVIFDELLPSYGTVSGIGRALTRFSRRLARPNPLAGSETELTRHHNSLEADFLAFTPEITAYSRQLIDEFDRQNTPCHS